MSHELHIHIITSSRRAITGLKVLLRASGLVNHVSVQDPKEIPLIQGLHSPDLVMVDTTCLAGDTQTPMAWRDVLSGTVPWCALVHNQEEQKRAAELGATYILPPGFAAESLFSVVTRCLSRTETSVLDTLTLSLP